MEEIQNISNMPDKVFKHFFTKKDRNIVNRVKECASSTCHEKISPSYINASLNNFKKGIVYFSKGDVVGFVVWKEKTEEMPNSMKMLASMTIERINFKPYSEDFSINYTSFVKCCFFKSIVIRL